LIDGFPRDLDNYEKWFKIMGELIDLRFLLLVSCSFVSHFPYTNEFSKGNHAETSV